MIRRIRRPFAFVVVLVSLLLSSCFPEQATQQILLRGSADISNLALSPQDESIGAQKQTSRRTQNIPLSSVLVSLKPLEDALDVTTSDAQTKGGKGQIWADYDFIPSARLVQDVFVGECLSMLQAEANEEDSEGNVTTEIAFDNITIEDNYFSNTGKAGVQAIHKGDFDSSDWSVNRNRNFVLKNNHFYRTGGSGIILSKMMNALVENNNFDQTGYDATPENDADFLDDRLANRGSGMWVFRCKNVIAQYNRSYGAHGSNDSYGMHIDFGNEDIIYQCRRYAHCQNVSHRSAA